jgi:hypothetical protein
VHLAASTIRSTKRPIELLDSLNLLQPARPVSRKTYSNGVRKTTYRDPDGNEIGLGGAPLAAAHEIGSFSKVVSYPEYLATGLSWL